VNLSAALIPLVSLGVVTVMSTVPAPGGEVTLIDVGELTVNVPAALEPKCTLVVSERFSPVIDTVVPPCCGPEPPCSHRGLSRALLAVS